MDSVKLNCSTNSFIARIFKGLIESGNKSSSLDLGGKKTILNSNCYRLPKVLCLQLALGKGLNVFQSCALKPTL